MNKKLVIAYYYPSGKINEKDIKKIDYINYSFGKIEGTDILISNEEELLEILKYQKNGIKVNLAIGGWGADGFSEALMDKLSRSKLVNSIMKVIKQYNLDGIDLDWEYPTSSVGQIKSNPKDRDNLTLFCEELSYSMKEYQKDLVLSIAIIAKNEFYDLKTLSNYIDYFNVMTYDYALCNIATHHTNLYGNSFVSCDKNIQYLLNFLPRHKIILGAAFYGRYGTFEKEKKLGAHLSTSLVNGYISYTKIHENIVNKKWVESFDEVSKASYIISDNLFVTYESKRSLYEKTKYVLEQDLGGIMFWELSLDTTGDLIEVISEVNKK